MWMCGENLNFLVKKPFVHNTPLTENKLSYQLFLFVHRKKAIYSFDR